MSSRHQFFEERSELLLMASSPDQTQRRRRRRRGGGSSIAAPSNLLMSKAPSLLLLALIVSASRIPNDIAASFFASASSQAPSKKINRCPLRVPPGIRRPPLVLGHRGASFHLPEHTLAGYRLALELGADYIEPDLVPTKDGTLVAIHTVDLNVTTDVHSAGGGKYRDRARAATINGVEKWGYYVHDFTWEEVQALRVRQRMSDSGVRSTEFDGEFGVPSFGQIVDLLHDYNSRVLPLIARPGWKKTGGVPGLYVELKEPAFLTEDAGITITDLFLDELASHPKASELLFDHEALCEGLKYDEYRVPPLVVQCFDGGALEYLHGAFRSRWMDFMTEDLMLGGGEGGGTNHTPEKDMFLPWIPPMVLLVGSVADCRSTEFWFEVEKVHIAGIGPTKECLLPSEADVTNNNAQSVERAKREAREWVARAHTLISGGLAVHPWTERSERVENGHSGGVSSMFNSAEDELRYFFYDLRVDGMFAENVGMAVAVGAGGSPDGGSESGEERGGQGVSEVGGAKKSGVVCVDEEKDLWFMGLSFFAIGAFVGSIVSCFASSYLTAWGKCLRNRKSDVGVGVGASGGLPRPIQASISMDEDMMDEGVVVANSHDKENMEMI